MNPRIEQRYFHICENVLKDMQTGTLSFINVRQGFILEAYPSSAGRFFVAAGLKIPHSSSNDLKQLFSQLKIISPENKIVLDVKQSFPLERKERKSPQVDFVFKIDRFICSSPGTYRVQLIDFPNELILAETEFEAVFPPKPNIPYKTEDEIARLIGRDDVIKKVESSVRCPKCKHEKKFTLQLEKDLFKRMEQELLFPDDLVYTCECGQWRIHLGRMMVFMYNKLGQKITGKTKG